MAKRETELTKLFRIIDDNLSKFYSSRPQLQIKAGVCACKHAQKQKCEQISFYSSQKKMISEAAGKLMENDSDDERIIGKILCLVVDYISKILELLGQDFLCECKRNLIAESLVMRHKINFIREENDKFFKLCEEKSAQCERLLEQLNDLKNPKHTDLLPITARLANQNKQNQQISLSKCPSSFQFSQHKSIRQSKISDNYEITRVETRETTQKGHKKYFNIEASKKERKSKIFQHDDFQHSKSFKK